MIIVKAFLLLFCLPGLTASLDEAHVHGAWLQDGLKWTGAPQEVNQHLQTGAATVIHFGENHTFALIHCWVYREPGRYASISHGDGRSVYVGKWESKGDDIVVEYRLVDRTIRIKGETLPGPVEQATVKDAAGFLSFKGQKFRRTAELDQSADEVLNGIKATAPGVSGQLLVAEPNNLMTH